MKDKYVGLDVHQSSTMAAVHDEKGEAVMESILKTEMEAIRDFVKGLRRLMKSPKKVGPTKPAKFVSQFPISEYRCGLRAGQRVRLKHDITVLDHKGQPTGKVHREGEIGSLLRGSKEPPVVVWLPQTDGAPHTWAAARPCAPVSRCSTSA